MSSTKLLAATGGGKVQIGATLSADTYQDLALINTSNNTNYSRTFATNGTYIAIGNTEADNYVTSSGIPEVSGGQGYVAVYDVATMTLQYTIYSPTHSGLERFGAFIDMSSDSIVVSGGSAQGFHIFRLSDGALLKTLNPENGEEYRVAITPDDNYIFTVRRSSGMLQRFQKSGGSWSNYPITIGDYSLGFTPYDLDCSNNYLVVSGLTTSRFFTKSSGWNSSGTISFGVGSSKSSDNHHSKAVAVSDSLGSVFIGNESSKLVGEYDLSTRSSQGTITPDSTSYDRQFGYSVSVDESNSVLAIGSTEGSGKVVLAHATNGSIPQQVVTDIFAYNTGRFGRRVEAVGGKLLVGWYDIPPSTSNEYTQQYGYLSVYNVNVTSSISASFTSFATSIVASAAFASNDEMFGEAVAMNQNYVVVGIPNQDAGGLWYQGYENEGKVMVFDRNSGILVTTLYRPGASYPNSSDSAYNNSLFGFSVDIDFNNNILIGAPGRYNGAEGARLGEAYLFPWNGSNWSSAFGMSSSTIDVDDTGFGHKVAFLHEDKLAVFTNDNLYWGTRYMRYLYSYNTFNATSSAPSYLARSGTNGVNLNKVVVEYAMHPAIGSPIQDVSWEIWIRTFNDYPKIFVYWDGGSSQPSLVGYSSGLGVPSDAKLKVESGLVTGLAIGWGDHDTVDILNYNPDTNNFEIFQTLTGDPGSGFGTSVAFTNNVLLVGAPNTDADSGAVYKYLTEYENSPTSNSGRYITKITEAVNPINNPTEAGLVSSGLTGGPDYNSYPYANTVGDKFGKNMVSRQNTVTNEVFIASPLDETAYGKDAGILFKYTLAFPV